MSGITHIRILQQRILVTGIDILVLRVVIVVLRVEVICNRKYCADCTLLMLPLVPFQLNGIDEYGRTLTAGQRALFFVCAKVSG